MRSCHLNEPIQKIFILTDPGEIWLALVLRTSPRDRRYLKKLSSLLRQRDTFDSRWLNLLLQSRHFFKN